MDTAYDGIHKEGFLQGGLGALTDTLINRHIQLYPGGITNGTSSIKTENHELKFFQQFWGLDLDSLFFSPKIQGPINQFGVALAEVSARIQVYF